MMNHDVTIAFCVFQLAFLLLDTIILLKTGRDIARKGEYTWFGALVCTHMVYLVLNSIWTLKEYDLLDIHRTAMTAISTVSLWTVTNCATSFFLFVMERKQIQCLRTGIGRWLRQLPAAVTTVLIAISPWTGLVFRISEEGYLVHGPVYLPTVLISSLYLLAVAVIACVNMIRERTSALRKANGVLLGSVLIILLFIAADSMFLKASILPAAIFAVILIIFITMQEESINSDALTGMNNRRKAEGYLTELLTRVSEENPAYLYIADLNGFKKINDTYGHIEGDDALILCSRALKRTAAQYDGFAARYGGDEFLMAWQPARDRDADPEALVRDASRYLEEQSTGKPYKMEICVGYARCADPGTPLSACIRQADEMLYERKEAVQAGR